MPDVPDAEGRRRGSAACASADQTDHLSARRVRPGPAGRVEAKRGQQHMAAASGARRRKVHLDRLLPGLDDRPERRLVQRQALAPPAQVPELDVRDVDRPAREKRSGPARAGAGAAVDARKQRVDEPRLECRHAPGDQDWPDDVGQQVSELLGQGPVLDGQPQRLVLCSRRRGRGRGQRQHARRARAARREDER